MGLEAPDVLSLTQIYCIFYSPEYELTWSPQQPTAFKMEALWMTRYGIPAFTALKTKSL